MRLYFDFARYFANFRGVSTACFLAVILSASSVNTLMAGSEDLFYPMRTDWSESNGKVNLSVYVFNDLDESGEYDLGDRAMSGIATGIRQSGIPFSISRSNGNGFANFDASSFDESAIIDAAGSYEFEVFSPPGWYISTGNQVQQREVIALPGSLAGLILSAPLEPVGLVRYKFVRGTYSLPSAGFLKLEKNGAVVAQAELAPGEEFLWPVEPGQYKLVSEAGSRPVHVGQYPVDIGKVTAFPPSTAFGNIVHFEDMAAGGLEKAPSGYGGLNWFNLNIMENNYMPDSVGTVNGATSGINIVYTSSGHPASIYRDSPFDFIGVNLTLAWPRSEGEMLEFRFFQGDNLALTDSIGLSAYGPITYQPLLSGITRIELSTPHYWQAVLDDLIVITP